MYWAHTWCLVYSKVPIYDDIFGFIQMGFECSRINLHVVGPDIIIGVLALERDPYCLFSVWSVVILQHMSIHMCIHS